MTEATPQPEGEPTEDVSPALRFLALVNLLLPIAGLLAHAAMYAAASPEWTAAYVRGPPIKVIAVVAFINLVGNWFHYRRTRMNLDIFARILTYLWILSIVLMVVYLARSPAAQ